MRLLARADRVAWGNDPDLSRSMLRRLLYPDAGIGPGWRSVIVSELPKVFRRLPLQARHDYVTRSWGPAGAWWLAERARDRFPLLTSHTIAHAVERGGKLVLAVRNRERTVMFETDHVIAATGYRVDLDRISYLSAGLAGKDKDLRRGADPGSSTAILHRGSALCRGGQRAVVWPGHALCLRRQTRGGVSDRTPAQGPPAASRGGRRCRKCRAANRPAVDLSLIGGLTRRYNGPPTSAGVGIGRLYCSDSRA